MHLSCTDPHGTLGSTRLPLSKISALFEGFLFHNTRLLSPDRVRCFLFPIPPASLQNICPPRGFFYFITHGCYLRTMCDAQSSKISIARHFNPAFNSCVVKFSVPASFPQTPRAPLHTHTPKPPQACAHTHTPFLARNPSKVPAAVAVINHPPSPIS